MTTPLQCLVEQGYWVGLGAGADDQSYLKGKLEIIVFLFKVNKTWYYENVSIEANEST